MNLKKRLLDYCSDLRGSIDGQWWRPCRPGCGLGYPVGSKRDNHPCYWTYFAHLWN